jgi:tetratricopeptide (TPR) repeat protein
MGDPDVDPDPDHDRDVDPDHERDLIDEVAEEFAQRCRRGEQPSVSEYAGRHPEYADQIRAMLPTVALMEQWKRRRRNPRGDEAAVEDPAGAPALQRLDDLRIVREIGRGGMGIVYEAVQETLGRRVALKVLPRHAFLDPKTLQRFRREAQAVAQLHHAHIVPVFGVGEHDGLHYYVMQLIPGRGLHEVVDGLRRGKSLDELHAPPGPGPARGSSGDGNRGSLDGRYWRFVARVGMQVAESLEYAHGQGVLHRDIKPANLLLDEGGKVWVTDFGLAKLAQQGDLTATGDIIGTLKYMAPEGLQGESDARSDVYGLGMTLYELLTLEPPFDDSNPSRLIRRLGEDQPIRPRMRNPAIPRDLETIVLKATAREPGDRYPTARALADDLARFLDDRPVRARRATWVERSGRWCRRNPALAALGVTALASLVFAAVVGWAGYAMTRKALAGESRRRQEADAATRRAEANVALSLRSLEEIFNNLKPHSIGSPFGARPNGPPPPPPREFGAGPPGGGSASGPRPGSPSRRGPAEGEAALLQSILGFYDRFAALNETNAKLKREAAKAYRHIGEIQQRLGQFDKADAAFRRAAALFEALADASPDRVDDRHALIETLIVQDPRSDAPDALASALDRWQRARALEEALAAEFPESPEYVAGLAEIQGRLGPALDRLGRTEEAEASFRRAVSLRESLTDSFPEDSLESLYLAVERAALGEFLLEHDRRAEARACLVASAEGLQAAATRPMYPRMEGGLAQQFDDLAALFVTLDEPARAEAMSSEAQVLRESRPIGRHPGPPPHGHAPGLRGRDRPPGGPGREDEGPFPLHARRPPPHGPGP